MGVFKFISVNSFLVVYFCATICVLFSGGCLWFYSLSLSTSNLFIFDGLSLYLIILVFFLGYYSQNSFSGQITMSSRVFLYSSLMFSIFSLCMNHSIIFWCCYELSMLPLLFLIFKDSPYSERFLAGWYFASYLLVTSVPLILLICYVSYINESFIISNWSVYDSSLCYVLLAFLFFTKVPLFPFHTWLPIVHAEATSIVSIYLSGYIMKLGLLGAYRCCFFVFNFDLYIYMVICAVASVCFLVVSSTELDGKRWLALLSLAHIVVSFLGLYICDWSSVSLIFYFCLGHGLSAGLVFALLWYFYDSVNSRNWVLLKCGVGNLFVEVVLVVSLLSLCSFPPTIQFFCELNLLSMSVNSIVLWVFWGLYLFFGGLVPLVLCGFIITRVESLESSSYYMHSYFLFFLVMIMWCYMSVLVL